MATDIYLDGDDIKFVDKVQTTPRKLDELSKGSHSAHKTRHENGGADEISIAGLSGEAADNQPPKAHKTSHQEGGADEVDPALHAAKHEDGGADEIDIAGLVGHQYGKNLILNPSFESYNIDTNLPDFWSLEETPTLLIAADTLFPARGGNQITITGAGATYEGIVIAGGVANWLDVLPATKYTVSFDYKVTAGDFLNVTIRSWNGAVSGTAHVTVNLDSTDATTPTYTFTTDADADNLAISFLAKNDGDICVVSHLKLEQGAIATPYIPPDRDRTCTRTEATNATPDPHIASRRNVHIITALGAAAELQLPTGTIYDGDSLIIRILDNSTGRAITYNAIYRGIVVALPDTTTADKTLVLGFDYDLAATKWNLLAIANEP